MTIETTKTQITNIEAGALEQEIKCSRKLKLAKKELPERAQAKAYGYRINEEFLLIDWCVERTLQLSVLKSKLIA